MKISPLFTGWIQRCAVNAFLLLSIMWLLVGACFGNVCDDLVYAGLAEAAYSDGYVGNKVIVETPGQNTSTEWVQIDYKYGWSGFAAATYKNESTGEIVVSFRGTEGLNVMDWASNIHNSLSTFAPQYYAAAEYAADTMAKNPNATVVFTGHSLGGGLAQYAALCAGGDSIGFNPATVDQFAARFEDNTSGSFRNYVHHNDILNDVANNLALGRVLGDKIMVGEEGSWWNWKQKTADHGIETMKTEMWQACLEEMAQSDEAACNLPSQDDWTQPGEGVDIVNSIPSGSDGDPVTPPPVSGGESNPVDDTGTFLLPSSTPSSDGDMPIQDDWSQPAQGVGGLR